ncbi:hypothetical protein FHX10_003242 [Rhizobium sp. BK591]|nr:hypothetical protein [Rhizobium sp. BK591]
MPNLCYSMRLTINQKIALFSTGFIAGIAWMMIWVLVL